ncbi:MAG: 2-dehydro-3-deoxyglucarate aldolase [Chloroflexi bacterium]|nr:2-dehydro-3-deoxyglucarate aldolase [Chloroflexota bacterium]
MNTNRLKARLRAGEPALGVSVMIPSPQIVEMLGYLGVDWVLLDCEHGTITLESLELMVIAAEAAGITAIARPAASTPEAILAVMDRGVFGVQAPHVVSAAVARQVVEAVKYHPLGRRGLAAGSRPARYGFGLSMADYVAWANAETLVCVQIEDAEALERVGEIAAVDGVDVCFVGPSDLAQSMGYPGHADAPPVRDAIDATFRTLAAAGMTAGCAGSPAALAGYLARGVRYLYTHVPTLLAAGAGELRRAGGR